MDDECTGVTGTIVTGVTGTIVSPNAILKSRENYEDWKAQLLSYLESQDLLDVLKPDSDPPERGDEQIKEWKKKNAAALHAIQVACGLHVLPVIRGIDTAKNAWSALAKWYLIESETFERELLEQESREDHLDIALDLVKRCPSFTITKSAYHSNYTPLRLLATRKSSFSGGRTLVFWKRWIYNYIKIKGTSCSNGETYIYIKEQEVDEGQSKHMISGLLQKIYECLYDKSGIKSMYEQKLVYIQSCEFLRYSWEHIKTLKDLDLEKKLDLVIHAVSAAMEEGNGQFVIEVMKLIPQPLFYKKLFPLAVENREPEIFSILYGLPHKRVIIRSTDDEKNYNLLHLVAKLAPPSKLEGISGAALQMQSEVQWFTEAKNLAEKMDNEARNEEGLTPEEVFRENHKKLMEDGESWMKGTATSCTVAAALIITIMFAAAFTTPSGKKEGDESGTVTVRDKWFLIYIASDAISLFSSTTSALVFLGILTSSYHEEAFLKSLPTQMIIGLSTLFISIAAMMTCFCAGLHVILQGDLWIFIPLILFASVPVSSFAFLQFPTLIEIIFSTYGSGPFDPQKIHTFLRD